MNKRLINACIVGLSLSLLCVYAFGGTSSTVTSPSTVMHLEGQTAVTLRDSPTLGTAHDQCIAKAKTTPGKHSCSDVLGITTVATCEGEPAPRIYLSLVDLPDGNGAKGWGLPEMETPTLKAGSETEFLPERDWLYVHNAKWPAGYPACWVRGWEDPSKWRANPKADPGKVFMELITPENTADNIDLPNDESYTCWPTDTECVKPS